MRHAWVDLSEHLGKGLRIYPEIGRREGWPKKCYNFIVETGGLVPYKNIEKLFEGLTFDWPFPQIFWNAKYNIMAEKDAIHLVDGSYDITSTQIVSPGGSWEIVDYQDFLMLSNGVELWYLDPNDNTLKQHTPDDDIPLFKTCANFRGQAFIGNIQSNWNSMDEASVAWSKIGEFDFKPGVKNEAAFTRASFGGELYRIRPLGDGLVVYGENGILGLVPLPSSPHVGTKNLPSNGVISRYAVDGDEHLHIFVDREFFIWKLSRDMMPKRIGYQEYMKLLDPDNLVINYDRLHRYFYISDGNRCFLLTSYGMSEIYQCVGSVYAGRGLVFKEGSIKPVIMSSRTSFGLPGEKLCTVVFADTIYDGIFYVLAENEKGYSVSARGNPRMTGYPNLAGTHLGVGIRFNEIPEYGLTGLRISIAHQGKHAVRGKIDA